MTNLLIRIRTLLTTFVTYLTLAGVVLGIVASELAGYAGNPNVEWVLRILAGTAIVIGVAVNIARRVAEVIPEDRGMLPIDHPTLRSLPRGAGRGTVVVHDEVQDIRDAVERRLE